MTLVEFRAGPNLSPQDSRDWGLKEVLIIASPKTGDVSTKPIILDPLMTPLILAPQEP